MDPVELIRIERIEVCIFGVAGFQLCNNKVILIIIGGSQGGFSCVRPCRSSITAEISLNLSGSKTKGRHGRVGKLGNADEKATISTRIHRDYSLPNCIGFADGMLKPLATKPRRRDASDYFGRKHGYSLSTLVHLVFD